MLGYTIEDSIDRLEKRVKKVEESGGGGGASTWNQLTGKPFNTVDSDTLSTDSNQLAVKAVPDDKIILSSGFEMPTLSEELTYLENEAITLDQDVEGIYQLLNYYADNGFLSYNLHYFSMEDIKETNPDATWGSNTAVYRGVTFTFNEDGSIGMEGTATGSINFFFLRRTGSNKLNIPAGNYFLSGCDDGSTTTYRLGITKTVGGSSIVVATQTDSPVEFNYTNEEAPYGYFIGVSSGATVNTVIRPMIRPVSITSSEYVPYAPSNIDIAKRTNSSSIKYSEQEEIIGTWTDGKPVYRKVINLTSTTTGEHRLSYDLSDVETMIKVDAMMNGYVGNGANPNSYANWGFVFSDWNTSGFNIYKGTRYSTASVRFIIEYTKK